MTTPDLSEFREAKPRPCKMARWIDTLDEEDQAKVRAAFDAEEISTSSIMRWANTRGADISHASTGHHRAGTCSCHRI